MPSAQHAGPAERGDRPAEQICWKELIPLLPPPPPHQTTSPAHSCPCNQVQHTGLWIQNYIAPQIQLKLGSVYTQKRILNGCELCLFLCLNGLFGFVCLLKFLGWLVGSLKGKATLRNADCKVCRETEKKLCHCQMGMTMSL